MSTTLIAPLGPAPSPTRAQLDVVVIANPLEHLDPAIDTTLALIAGSAGRSLPKTFIIRMLPYGL